MLQSNVTLTVLFMIGHSYITNCQKIGMIQVTPRPHQLTTMSKLNQRGPPGTAKPTNLTSDTNLDKLTNKAIEELGRCLMIITKS